MITNGYCTLAEIKSTKRISSTNADDDAFIEDLVEATSRYIDGVTGRRFFINANDETRTYTADSINRIYTDDIVSVTTLKTDEDEDRTYETTWQTTDYDLLPENAALDGQPYSYIEVTPLGDFWFPTHRKGVQIVGKFGWAAAPQDINTATRIIVVSLYLSRFGANVEGVATITGAGVVITPKDIPASAMELIKPYVRLFR